MMLESSDFSVTMEVSAMDALPETEQSKISFVWQTKQSYSKLILRPL